MKVKVTFRPEDFRRKIRAEIYLNAECSDCDLPVNVFEENKFVGEEGRKCCIFSPVFSTQTACEAWVDSVLVQIGAFWREIQGQRIFIPECYDLSEKEVMNL